MSAPIVSIIVPVYKVEALLPRCLESIAAQTFRYFECILVDDGSPDGSGAICDAWAARDARFIPLHKPNGGPSSARNAGLDVARGNWIVFCDSDDFIHPRLLELALAVQKEASPNAVVCWKHGSQFPSASLLHPCWEPGRAEQLFLEGSFPSSYTKLWNHHFLSSLSLRFDETIRWAEDLEFTCRYLLALLQATGQAELALIPYVLYVYNPDRPGNLTTSRSSPKLECELRVIPELLDVFEALVEPAAVHWASFCQLQLFTLISRMMDFYQSGSGLSSAARRQQVRAYLASPPMRRFLALCRKYHVWPAMQLCANHGLVRTAFFLERNCYKPWYMRLIRAWVWMKNKFYWGWQAVKGPFARGKD